jgi:hypothetical protein
MPQFLDVVDFMGRHDFAMYDIGDVFRRPFDGALGSLDVLFVRNTSSLRASWQW